MSALDTLRDDIQNIELEDEQSLLEYIALAARLAALGDSQWLQAWRAKGSEFGQAFENALLDRCREGEWDLRSALGIDLAYSLIECQDMYLFYQLERDLLSPRVQRCLEAWFDHSVGISLDDEAWESVMLFFDLFDIPDDQRLPSLVAPLPEAAIDLFLGMTPPELVTIAEWTSPETESTALKELAHFADDRPADRLRREFDRLETVVDVEGVGTVSVSRRIGDDWQVVIDVELMSAVQFEELPPELADLSSADDDPVPAELTVATVRLGALPAQPLRADGSRWEVALRPFEHMRRVDMMEEMLEIRWSNGRRLRLK